MGLRAFLVRAAGVKAPNYKRRTPEQRLDQLQVQWLAGLRKRSPAQYDQRMSQLFDAHHMPFQEKSEIDRAVELLQAMRGLEGELSPAGEGAQAGAGSGVWGAVSGLMEFLASGEARAFVDSIRIQPAPQIAPAAPHVLEAGEAADANAGEPVSEGDYQATDAAASPDAATGDGDDDMLSQYRQFRDVIGFVIGLREHEPPQAAIRLWDHAATTYHAGDQRYWQGVHAVAQMDPEDALDKLQGLAMLAGPRELRDLLADEDGRAWLAAVMVELRQRVAEETAA